MLLTCQRCLIIGQKRGYKSTVGVELLIIHPITYLGLQVGTCLCRRGGAGGGGVDTSVRGLLAQKGVRPHPKPARGAYGLGSLADTVDIRILHDLRIEEYCHNFQSR